MYLSSKSILLKLNFKKNFPEVKINNLYITCSGFNSSTIHVTS